MNVLREFTLKRIINLIKSCWSPYSVQCQQPISELVSFRIDKEEERIKMKIRALERHHNYEELLEYEEVRVHPLNPINPNIVFFREQAGSLLPCMNDFLQKCDKLTAEENEEFLLFLRNLPQKLSS